MQRLRNARLIARMALAWFALSLCAAVASPMVKPMQIELICSASGGMKVLIKTDDGAHDAHSHTLDCPLCINLCSPPPAPWLPSQPAQSTAYSPCSTASAHVAWVTAAPLPARGPPALS